MIPKNSLKLTIPVTLSYGRILGVTKPTPFLYNIYTGFSMPIYNSDDEELYYTAKWRERWDGVTNPHMKIYCCLTGAEDVGDKFKFQLSGSSVDCETGTVLPATTNEYYGEATVIEGKTAANSFYCVDIEFDATKFSSKYMSAGRLRRINSSGPEVTNEIAILHAVIELKRDKIGARYNY